MSTHNEEQGVQGWTPRLGDDLTLEKVIDLAFDYRGDVTVDKVDGGQVIGYLYNRNAAAAQPFVQLFEAASGAQVTLAYAEIENVRFTGRDTAAGQSYEAWKARREASQNAGQPG